MTTLDKIIYLNLKRRPDRNTHFLNECMLQNIPGNLIQRFDALDGSTYNFTAQELQLFSDKYYCEEKYTKKVQSNQLGHYYILKEIIEKEYDTVLILQDDAIFCKDFLMNLNNVLENIPEDADFINIGLHKIAFYDKFLKWDLDTQKDYLFYEKTKVNEYVCKAIHKANPCSLGFICTRKGAINLLKHIHATKFDEPTDHYYNAYLQKKDNFYFSRKILCTGNPDLGTDIFTK